MSKYIRAHDFIKKLVENYSKGSYIFRGTTLCYSEEEGEGGLRDGINSNLYRWVVKEEKEGEIAKEQETLKKIFSKNEHFSPSDMEKEIFENARKHFASNEASHEILTELQHFGGKTNMIDFSRNIYIALFFACQGDFEDIGELIGLREKKFQEIKKISYEKRPRQGGALEMIEPAGTQSSRQRVSFQSSVFVRPMDGYINPNLCNITPIPADHKKPLMAYLQTFHNITPITVYNDMHGFIKNERNNQTASLYFYIGLASQNEGDAKKAIVYYSISINKNPNVPVVYNNLGNAYAALGKYGRAIKKGYDKAILLSPNYALAYNNRGVSYKKMKKYVRAIRDYDKAISIDPHYASAYFNRGLAKQEMGDEEGAKADFAKATSLNFVHPDEE